MTGRDDFLIGADAPSPDLRRAHADRLSTQLDAQLAPPRRIGYALAGLGGLVGAIVCGSLALTEPQSTPAGVRALLGLFALMGLGWIVFATWALARSRGGFEVQRTVAARMGFGFTLATIVALAAVASSQGKGAEGGPMLAVGLALLVLAAVMLIEARIERSESSLREQVLRLEARLADLAFAPVGQGPKQIQ